MKEGLFVLTRLAREENIMKKGARSFTTLEVLTVFIIIGILTAVVLPNFGPFREHAADKEAFSNLRRMQEAQRVYLMEHPNYSPLVYYPPVVGGSQSDIYTINRGLKLMMDATANRRWNYMAVYTGCVQATRRGDNGRSWYLTIDREADPQAGTCPGGPFTVEAPVTPPALL
jgi:type II secretory pathway pseudopilin PulG